ncbi:ATP-binding protein [Ruminococcus sp.]|uniref:ATP-binding protein n=1 Tax=Ruminococcus sp. TaxID=41978 RepID=UPI002E76B769|nr:ATP-binding protein [Ruminococcus sp.]MEE1262334.1 ATP-binding protein [Ruminococcus sp.]
MLTEIFHKTLAANVKRRYQSADDLARALSELCDVIESHSPYIFTPRYVSTCNFVGRNDELAQLHRALSDNSLVFVHGAGGIGKTELVRKYIAVHQDEYDAVVFMLYNGSVSECLNEIEIIGIDSEDKDNKSLLKEICDENVLLILDNYDVAPNESKGLDELLDLNCKVIVTTRTDFSERNPNAHFIEVSGLSPIALRVVFENESGLTLSDSEFEDMQTILHIGQECTYFWSMIARLAKEGAYSVSEIVEKVNTGLDDLEDSEDVFDTKDGNNINTTVATAMLILFRLDELTDKDFEVLKAMYFLDCLNMGKRQIKEMLAFSTNKLMNFFNALVKKGYIQRLTVAKYEVYRISDVLRNVLEYKEELDISENRIATAFIDEKLYIDKVALNDPTIRYRLYVKDQANNTLICLFKILSGLNWDISGNALYSIDKMYRLFAGESLLFRYAYESCVLTIIKNIVRIYRKEISLITRVKINIIIIAWFCFDIMICQSDYQCEIAKIIEDSFYEVLSAMEKINIDNSEAMDNLCKPITALFVGFTTLCNCFSANIIKTILSINPPCIKEESVDTVLRSFRINCLKNNKYEKEYLKSTLDKIEKANDSDKVRISYLSIGLIALNGEDVSIKIDEELKVLRDRVLDVCRDVFFNGTDDTKPNLVKVNIFDFLPNIARSETQRAFEIMSIGL